MKNRATKILGHVLYLLPLSVVMQSDLPIFVGRWGWETTLLLVLVMGLLYRPFRAWLDLITTRDSIRFPNGHEVRIMRKHRVWIALLGVVLLLGPLEIALRVNRVQQRRHLEAFHPFLQKWNVPGDPTLPVNAHGFRGEEITREKPDGVFRIFVVGGSTVYCNRVTWDQSHVRLLENKLRAAYPDRRIEVVNGGAEWYTSQHALINYDFRIRDYAPDLVICWHAINDLYRSFTPSSLATKPFRADYAHHYGAVSRMIRHYFRGDAAHGRWTGLEIVDRMWSVVDERLDFAVEPTNIETFQSLEPFRHNVASLAERLRLDGVPLVLCTQPHIYHRDLDDDEKKVITFPRSFCVQDGKMPTLAAMERGMQSFNGALAEIAARFEVPLVDLEAAVPKNLQHFVDDCHYTPKGNEVVAETLFIFLQSSDLLR